MAESEIRTSPVDRVVRHLGIDHTVESVRIDRRGARAVLRSAAGETREIDCRFEDAVWHLSTYGLDIDQDTTTTLRPNYHTRMRVEMTDDTAQRIRYLSGARGVSPSHTEFGPPDRMTPVGANARTKSSVTSNPCSSQ